MLIIFTCPGCNVKLHTDLPYLRTSSFGLVIINFGYDIVIVVAAVAAVVIITVVAISCCYLLFVVHHYCYYYRCCCYRGYGYR